VEITTFPQLRGAFCPSSENRPNRALSNPRAAVLRPWGYRAPHRTAPPGTGRGCSAEAVVVGASSGASGASVGVIDAGRSGRRFEIGRGRRGLTRSWRGRRPRRWSGLALVGRTGVGGRCRRGRGRSRRGCVGRGG